MYLMRMEQNQANSFLLTLFKLPAFYADSIIDIRQNSIVLMERLYQADIQSIHKDKQIIQFIKESYQKNKQKASNKHYRHNIEIRGDYEWLK